MKKQIKLKNREFGLIQKDGYLYLEFDEDLTYDDLLCKKDVRKKNK